MLTRRGAFRQRGMDLPKIQTNITAIQAAVATTTSPIHDVDADLAEFIQVDDSCLDFLTPTSSSTTTPEGASGSSAGSTPQGGDDEVPWPRPMDRDIHGRSDLKHTAPRWAIRVRWVLSRDFDEQDSSSGQEESSSSSSIAAAAYEQQGWGRRPSVVDRRFSYGRKIQAGGGRRPSDFSLRAAPPGGLLRVRDEDIPFELVLCSEEDSLYSN
ncbi:hypothetical protein Daus18300_000381 [Diaporthe australafricana]|uniref:Uncharacterized protein n=1 Tax=Diaporthe australafricana TaxID=127596 RepID=A0ABR3Y5J6_9PEZI